MYVILQESGGEDAPLMPGGDDAHLRGRRPLHPRAPSTPPPAHLMPTGKGRGKNRGRGPVAKSGGAKAKAAKSAAKAKSSTPRATKSSSVPIGAKPPPKGSPPNKRHRRSS